MSYPPYPRFEVIIKTKKNGENGYRFYRKDLVTNKTITGLVIVTTAIPFQNVAALEAQGVRFSIVPGKEKKPYSVYDFGTKTRSTSPYFIDSYIRLRGSEKNFYGKKKPVQMISTAQVNWLAKTHGVSPSVAKSVIRHADQVVLKEIDAYKGFTRQVTRPRTEHTPPRLVAKKDLAEKITVLRRLGIPYPVDLPEDTPHLPMRGAAPLSSHPPSTPFSMRDVFSAEDLGDYRGFE